MTDENAAELVKDTVSKMKALAEQQRRSEVMDNESKKQFEKWLVSRGWSLADAYKHKTVRDYFDGWQACYADLVPPVVGRDVLIGRLVEAVKSWESDRGLYHSMGANCKGPPEGLASRFGKIVAALQLRAAAPVPVVPSVGEMRDVATRWFVNWLGLQPDRVMDSLVLTHPNGNGMAIEIADRYIALLTERMGTGVQS